MAGPGACRAWGPSTASSTLISVSVLSADPLVEAAGERVSSREEPVVVVAASEEERTIGEWRGETERTLGQKSKTVSE